MDKQQDSYKHFDWERIGAELRAGVWSIRQIARRHGLTETAIRKRAKRDGWTRDLTDKVALAFRTGLLRSGSQPKSTDEIVIEEGAGAVIAVVREHRKTIGRAQDVVDVLLAQLMDAVENPRQDRRGDRGPVW